MTDFYISIYVNLGSLFFRDTSLPKTTLPTKAMYPRVHVISGH